MKTTEESVVAAMDGRKDTEIFQFLPYILQDFWEMGTSPEEVIELLEKHTANHAQLNVLDLGCGKGAVSVKLAKKFRCHCLGIDAVKEFVDDASSRAEEFSVDSLCQFIVGDIRHEIDKLSCYDVIILGAIGQVFGNYVETLTILLPHLKNNGVIIIDDGYIEDRSNFSHSSVLKRRELLNQIDVAGMVLVDEITAGETTFDENDKGFRSLSNRCNELIAKYPHKTSLFQGYISNQKEEYAAYKADIKCSIMLLKRR